MGGELFPQTKVFYIAGHSFLHWSRERSKPLRNYFPLTIFTKRFILDVWIISLGFWVRLGFWISPSSDRGSEYTRILNMFLILNMSGFCICQGSKYARVAQGFEYAWIIRGYAWFYMNGSKSVRMAFVLHIRIVNPYLKDP